MGRAAYVKDRENLASLSGPQAVTVNTQTLHCSQEDLGSEGKSLSAEELKKTVYT